MEGVDCSGEPLPDLSLEKEVKGKANRARTASSQARRKERRGATKMNKELARIPWPTVLNWAQHLEDLAEDFRWGLVAWHVSDGCVLVCKDV